VGKAQIIAAAQQLGTTPFITKHNRAGKGLGVRRFDSVSELISFLGDDAYPAGAGDKFEDSVDGITLVQQYIESPQGCIYRAEFVGGKYLYTVRVDTGGSFNLCPADNCRVEVAESAADAELTREVTRGAAAPIIESIDLSGYHLDNTPTFSTGIEIDSAGDMFTIIDDPRPDLTAAYERFLAANGIDVAGIEYIIDKAGVAYTYDVNTNTNYNADAEARAGQFAMLELARLLGDKLSVSANS